MHSDLVAACAAATIVFSKGTALAQTGGSGAGAALELRALSTRPEAISGGDVLVQVSVPRDVALDRLSVTLNGRDVRSAFRPTAHPHVFVGLISSLSAGLCRREDGAA